MVPAEPLGDGRGSQLLRGVLDVCILALIAERPRYGYEIARQLEERGLELVGEGSIYPLLSRLQRSGHIEGYLVPSNEGPPRKYYRPTPLGRRALRSGVTEWEAFARGVDRVVKGGKG
jgi:PadR family transcriptional regulator, regulatory protein PadR